MPYSASIYQVQFRACLTALSGLNIPDRPGSSTTEGALNLPNIVIFAMLFVLNLLVGHEIVYRVACSFFLKARFLDEVRRELPPQTRSHRKKYEHPYP